MLFGTSGLALVQKGLVGNSRHPLSHKNQKSTIEMSNSFNFNQTAIRTGWSIGSEVTECKGSSKILENLD